MKIKHSIFALTLALPIFNFANTSQASNKYTPCSTTQIEQLKPLIPLTTDEIADDNNYQSCLLVDPEKQTFLVANSNKIATDKNEKGEEESSTYDLTAYLIDGKQQKLLSQKVLSKDIGSDALHFDGIELDTTPFSTLPNTTVLGLLQKHSHNGAISHGDDDLQLLKIDSSNILPIGKVTVNTYANTSWDDDCGKGMQGKGYHDHKVKNTLVLSNTTHNGLQDIIVKSHKTNEGVAGKTCKPFKKTWQKQQSIKFDGNKYDFVGVGLENDGV